MSDETRASGLSAEEVGLLLGEAAMFANSRGQWTNRELVDHLVTHVIEPLLGARATASAEDIAAAKAEALREAASALWTRERPIPKGGIRNAIARVAASHPDGQYDRNERVAGWLRARADRIEAAAQTAQHEQESGR